MVVVEIGRVLMRRTVEKSGLVSAPPGPAAAAAAAAVPSSVKVLDFVRSGGLCNEDEGFVFWLGGSESSSSSSLDLDIVKKRR